MSEKWKQRRKDDENEKKNYKDKKENEKNKSKPKKNYTEYRILKKMTDKEDRYAFWHSTVKSNSYLPTKQSYLQTYLLLTSI